jgi:hypothetical protein
MKMDIVIQGGLWNTTIPTAVYYQELDFVDKVVISTWEDDPKLMSFIDTPALHNDLEQHNIELLQNKKPDAFGPGNVNLQIVSSLEGIKSTTQDIVFKVRTDEKIYHESFHKIYDFFMEHKDQESLSYLDSGEKQKSKIFVIGNNRNYPYHPQDHIYMGYREDLLRLFSLPLSTEPPYPGAICPPNYFTEHIRSPMYIGMCYYALFFEEAVEHVKDWRNCLLDDSARRPEVMEFYDSIKDLLFQPLPRIKLDWEKYNSGYWYNYEADGEYYAD